MEILINWPTYDTLENSASKLNDAIQNWKPSSLLLAVSYQLLLELPPKISSSGITYGANTMNRTAKGAFTDSVASQILKRAGAQFVIIGSASSRKVSQDSPEEIQTKISSALLNGLQVYLCVEEESQISSAFLGLEPHDQARISLIYEGPWATSRQDFTTEEIHHSHVNFQQALKNALPEIEVKVLQTIPCFFHQITELETGFTGYYFPSGPRSLNLLNELFISYADRHS